MIWPFRKRTPVRKRQPAAGRAPAWAAPSLDEALNRACAPGSEAFNAIPALAPAIAYPRGALGGAYPPKVARRLDAALDDLLRRMPPSDIIRIGQRLRAEGLAWPAWLHLDVADFAQVITGGTNDFARLAILSMHPSGHLRERALRRLDVTRGDDALPFLLASCVDWVAEVQTVAWAAIRRRLVPASAPVFVAALPLVLRLRDFRRVRCAPLVAEVLQFLAAEDGALESGLNSPRLNVRHACWDAMAERDLLRTEHAFRAVTDSVLTRKAGAFLERRAREASASLQQRVVSALSESTAPEMRLSALLLAERCALADATNRHRVATIDQARSVRQQARYHLREAGVVIDHRRTYRDALPNSLGAIAGLGEVGEPSDWEALVTCLEAGARHACEAIRSMRTLNATESRDMRMFLVQEKRPKVSRAAATSLEGEIHGGDEAEILECMRSEFVHVRRHGIRLASFLPGWRAPLLIAPFVQPDTRTEAALALARWRVRPSPSRAEFNAWRQWMRASGVSKRDEEKRADWARFRFDIEV